MRYYNMFCLRRNYVVVTFSQKFLATLTHVYKNFRFTIDQIIKFLISESEL